MKSQTRSEAVPQIARVACRRDRDRLRPVRRAEAVIHTLEVLFHGPDAEAQREGDLIARLALQRERQHLGLARGEPERSQRIGPGQLLDRRQVQRVEPG